VHRTRHGLQPRDRPRAGAGPGGGGLLGGRPEELVGALLFLASPASDFVNGQILYVDGGMSAVI
jgi:NAD(P)-dependent dehydrogenase (short-subunit alcohol dehydrogenase family)